MPEHPIPERTILIFPRFENMDIIDHWRERYDPLAKLVRPHITVVFPFRHPMTDEELSAVLEEQLRSVEPFDLVLQGIRGQTDRFGSFLFLNITEGAEQIRRISRSFYDREFRRFDLGLPYEPHMTVGSFGKEHDLVIALSEIEQREAVFHTRIEEICAERIGEKGESIVILRQKLKEQGA